LAAFAEAPVALAAALAAQRVIGTEAWELPEPPRVRMALHTGSVESRNGEYVGPVLNRAARVLAAGHGGQVLLSLATEQLVREHLPPETTLRDLGTHRLKDLSLPEQIFQVAVPDLPASFPALNTLDARHTNLPAQPTALIGREQEVVAVATLLRRSNVRLVTLTGPGGVGKTRLSLQAAAELVDDFAHGVYFVDLAPIREPSLVTSAIAATLRVRESGGQPLLAALKDYLRDKRLLLLLDNFEHLLDAASLVAELLAAAAQLKVLVTSREVLHLRGEKEVSVQPLALPNPAQLPPLEQLSQYAAVALFVERALDARPDFVLTNAHAPAVAEICARLDGLPLAIELAAVRLKLFTPEALLERLSSRLPVLTGGARDLPMRQQTMRATIAWSYDLLTDAEQALFRRLGVFVGGCTPEAIDAVCSFAGDASLGVQPEVAALVDKSLLRQIAMPEGETRFSPLETIREYAQEQLDASGEAQQMHLRHARYYLALSQQGVSDHIEFVGSWVHRLDREYDNLHAALVWSRRSASDAALALQLSGALIPLWRHRGFYRDAIAALEQALNQPRAGSSSVAIDGLEQIHRYMRRTLANLLAGTGNFSAAHIQFEQLLLRAREQGDTQLAGYMCERLGWLAREQGDSTTAWRWMTESLTIFRELGDARAIAGTLVSMAGIAIVEEDAGQVELLLAESRALAEHAAPDIYAWTLNHLGNAAQLRGDYTRAAQLHRDSLAVFPSDYHAGVRSAYHSLGESVLGLGQLEEAARWLRQGLALSRRLNARDTIAWCLAGLGSAAALNKEPERAARLWGAAEQLRQTI
nr:tetratricopeptide repeat protein [Kouleothrix sp.]